MKFIPLILRNLLRRKVRTTFTILSIVVAFLLFGFSLPVATTDLIQSLEVTMVVVLL